MAGSNQGSLAFFPIKEPHPKPANGSLSTSGAALSSPVMALQGIHTDVVRSVQCFGSGSQQVIMISSLLHTLSTIRNSIIILLKCFKLSFL